MKPTLWPPRYNLPKAFIFNNTQCITIVICDLLKKVANRYSSLFEVILIGHSRSKNFLKLFFCFWNIFEIFLQTVENRLWESSLNILSQRVNF